MILAFSFGTFLAYVIVAVIIIGILFFYGASKEPLTMYGIPADRVKKVMDRLDDWEKKLTASKKL